MVRLHHLLAALAATAGVALINCASGDDAGSADSNVTDANVEYVDCNEIAGIPGLLPKDASLTALENIGRCSWVLGTGRTTENPKFQRKDKNGNLVPGGLGGTENLLSDIYAKNKLYVAFPLILAAKGEKGRAERWQRFGTMNDPGCSAREDGDPDEFGLYMDKCKDPFSAGVVGFRKFPNPKFNKAKWDANAYVGGKAKDMEPPYLVGLTCGACHTSFNPLKPPPKGQEAAPKWENLIFTIGNQYFNEGELYKPITDGPKDFKYQVLQTQERGTSDTSGIATDHVNNPNAINSIVNLLSRPFHNEKLKKGQVTFDLTKPGPNGQPELDMGLVAALSKMTPQEASQALKPVIVKEDGEEHAVQSILKGGEDSVGPVGALLRVFVNIGMCSKQWVSHFDPVKGVGEETPLTSTELYENCPSYEEMLSRVPAMVLFLGKQAPLYLKDAPDGPSFVDNAKADKGKLVFADQCARCHSSKQPANGETFRDLVMKPDFLQGNFLSDDKDYPVTEIGTNAARALHSNHTNGKIWSEAYASKTYSERKFPGPITVKNPYGGDLQFTGPDGGPGYYRTPTLISIWAKAPFMHNKAMGLYTGDPSIAGRMKAFDDAAAKLLWPEKRAGVIKKTASDSVLDIEHLGLKINIPQGTPVNLFANLDPNDTNTKLRVFKLGVEAMFGASFDANKTSLTATMVAGQPETVGTRLLQLSLCPDLIEDRGHLFGTTLSDEEKKNLIEYMKTL
jgi:hypothetical protein